MGRGIRTLVGYFAKSNGYCLTYLLRMLLLIVFLCTKKLHSKKIFKKVNLFPKKICIGFYIQVVYFFWLEFYDVFFLLLTGFLLHFFICPSYQSFSPIASSFILPNVVVAQRNSSSIMSISLLFPLHVGKIS